MSPIGFRRNFSLMLLFDHLHLLKKQTNYIMQIYGRNIISKHLLVYEYCDIGSRAKIIDPPLGLVHLSVLLESFENYIHFKNSFLFKMSAKKHFFVAFIFFICAMVFMFFVAKVFVHQNRKIDTSKQAFNVDVPAFAAKRIRLIEQLTFAEDSNLELINMDTNISCERWAVVTTIFKASAAVRKVARDPAGCLVVIGDKNSPEKAEYRTDVGPTAGKHCLFLWPDDQERIFPLLSRVVPWNDFSRKNIGYLYAIKHGAQWILDFDNDNVNLLTENIVENVIQYRAPFTGFSFHILNPYLFFL